MPSHQYMPVLLRLDELEQLKDEPKYVRQRFFIVKAMTLPKPFRMTRKEAARILRISIRHIYRIIKEYHKYGIAGLRLRSRRPKRMPNISPEWLENIILVLKKSIGLSCGATADIINEGFQRNNLSKKVGHSTVYKIIKRSKTDTESKPIKEEQDLNCFDWKHADNLIQADITVFNGVPILTMEDDHTRKAWAKPLENERIDTVIEGMKELIPYRYNNLLTDNGSQFHSRNRSMQQYLKDYVNEKHIRSSVRHPQTLGKVSAYQKGLKRFLRYHMKCSNDRNRVSKLVEIYNLWYNNGKWHSAIEGYPQEKYCGCRDMNWFPRLMNAFGLRDIFSTTLGSA